VGDFTVKSASIIFETSGRGGEENEMYHISRRRGKRRRSVQ